MNGGSANSPPRHSPRSLAGKPSKRSPLLMDPLPESAGDDDSGLRYLFILLAFSFFLLPFRLDAASTQSGEAVHFLTKAIASYEQGDFGAAKTSLNMALQAQPN